MTENYCKGCETSERCRWCPNNKSKDRCGFCGSEISTEQSVRTGRLWKELADTKKKLDRSIWWLKEIVENHRYTPISTAEKALAEINQKEKK